MNNEEKILALLEAMQAEQRQMREEQKRTNDRLDKIEEDLSTVKTSILRVENDLCDVKVELGDVKSTVARIETDHGRSLGLLVDGHIQNADKLDRIEREVTRHEEVILRRVK